MMFAMTMFGFLPTPMLHGPPPRYRFRRRQMLAGLYWLLALACGPAAAQDEFSDSPEEVVQAADDDSPLPGTEESTPAPPWGHLAQEIARHFKVAENHANEVVMAVMAASERHNLPAGVLLGLIAVESDFRHHRRRKSGTHGLMQVHSSHYPETARGGDGQHPPIAEHVDVGSRILRRYLDLYRTLPRALQRYKGQLNGPPHYANRVLDWQSSFEAVQADSQRRLVAPPLRVRAVPYRRR